MILYENISTYIYIYVMYVCVYIYIYMYILLSLSIYIYAYIYIYTCICVYIHNIHLYTCIHITPSRARGARCTAMTSRSRPPARRAVDYGHLKSCLENWLFGLCWFLLDFYPKLFVLTYP